MGEKKFKNNDYGIYSVLLCLMKGWFRTQFDKISAKEC